MDQAEIKKVARNNLSQEIATRTTDPNFYGALTYLPNPDEVLRKLGRSHEVFDAIVADSHVIGELRSIRAGMLGFEWRLQVGGDQSADIRALELCQQVMDNRPSNWMRWSDVIWNMAQAVFRGYKVHEVVWERFGQYLLPAKVVDRPERRFVYSPDNELRLKTRDKPIEGIELGAYKWLLTRHMPSYENPYGVAVFSSCFWPYTFKHSGFRYFVKFCEKYGIPWAIGKYPEGTPKPQQDALVDGLVAMIEDGVASIPDNNKVELLEAKHSGELVHERLVNICNREISKALTSQTLATEIQGEGSRAASETHRKREESVNESDREMICDTINELFAWITEINIPGARPPRFEFYQEEEARKEWVEVFDKGRAFIDIPAQFAHDRMQIPMPKEGEAVLPRSSSSQTTEFESSQRGHDFEGSIDNQAIQQADEIIESLIDEVRELLERSKTLDEFQAGLVKLYPDIDETRLGEMSAMALMTEQLQGADDA